MPRVYVSLIQSDLGEGRHGNFEAVIREGKQLWYWHRDNSNAELSWTPDNSEIRLPWVRSQRVTGEGDDVAGPGCIIQSTPTTGAHGNFEVVVPLRLANGRTELQHFYRDNSFDHLPSPLRQRLTMSVHMPWARGLRVTGEGDVVAGPACLIQSTFRAGRNRRFEVVVPLLLPDGSMELRHFFQNNSDIPGLWTKAQFITQSCAGFGSIIQSSFGSADHRDFEVLVDERRGSVVHYWHLNTRPQEVWIRTNRFTILERHPLLSHRAQKIVQLTGEFDREGWDGAGTPSFAFNRTQSKFGIIGTDLGVSFVHRGRLYFLFGDSWRVGYTDPKHDDAIAFCTDKKADEGIELTFSSQPPLVHGITQGIFEVPLDGVSWNGSMYTIFSTDHRTVGKYIMMGRSILSRTDNNGLDFTFLH